jgi:ubiquinone/menaquinone biosynthesis C-methylase UbiE
LINLGLGLAKHLPDPFDRTVHFWRQVRSEKPLLAEIEYDEVKLEAHRRKPQSLNLDDRFTYQSQCVDFDISSGDTVLDVGCGDNPFPYATQLVDLLPEPSKHRARQLDTAGKPFVVADVHALPFPDKSFDFVYCSHLLEHVEDPIAACRELMRVGKRGYIETPTGGKDTLFAWIGEMHNWQVVASGDRLCFFEYSERQRAGIRSKAWYDVIVSEWFYPLQEAFAENQDVFNVMFPWDESFGVVVFRLDGTIEGHNVELTARSGEGRGEIR